MKYISSGNGQIPLITLIAMLSVSLTVNLPGLAISPIMGKLDDVFPDAGQLQIQLLTVMPNLIIIPFILLSGKLTSMRNQTAMLAIGLSIFVVAGALCFFAESMAALIWLSALLGIGCGLVIPIAAGLLAERFYGPARVRVLGMKSGTSNGIVVLATIFVGWMAAYGWHFCFAVYLIPVIPLLLIPFLANRFINSRFRPEASGKDAVSPAPEKADPDRPQLKRPAVLLWGLIGIYITMTYCSTTFSYYLPFTMKHYGLSTGQVGVATAMFYLLATIGGFLLTRFLKIFGRTSLYTAIIITACGLIMMGTIHEVWSYILSVALVGIGYGILQPVIYDKTTYIAPTGAVSTRYFSYVLTASYVALAILPFGVEAMRYLFDARGVNFPYLINAAILLVLLVIGIVCRRSYVWTTERPDKTTSPNH